MPEQNDPTGSGGANGVGSGSPGDQGGAVPVGVPTGVMPGGTDGDSINEGPLPSWLTDPLPPWVQNQYWCDLINSTHTPAQWFDENFGPGSDFSNNWNNTFNPR